jgi:FecR-like protein
MSDAPQGPPPIDPMSDVAWARVERGLMARLDSGSVADSPRAEAPRRRWAWLAVPALAAAAVLVVVLAMRGVETTTEPSHPGSNDEMSRVVAGDAPSSVSFGDAHVALDARSAIVMSREGGSPSVLLERGTAAFTVAPRGDRPPFVVRAGDTLVRVVGTQFRVARSEEHVAVSVDHGIVDVQYRGTTVRVAAGQSWHSESPEAVTTVAIAPPTPAPVVAPDPIAPVPPPAPAPDPRVVAPVAPAPTIQKAPESDQVKFERLARIEARDPAAALAGYLELSRGSSAWAPVALYAAGRLAADRGDPRATTFLSIYVRRFPTGANVTDARNLLQRLEGDHR